MKTTILKFLSSGSNESSKRLVGVSCSFALIAALLMYHTDALVYSVTTLAVSSLGLTIVENLFKNKE